MITPRKTLCCNAATLAILSFVLNFVSSCGGEVAEVSRVRPFLKFPVADIETCSQGGETDCVEPSANFLQVGAAVAKTKASSTTKRSTRTSVWSIEKAKPNTPPANLTSSVNRTQQLVDALDNEPFRVVGHGENASAVVSFHNSTELKWVEDAIKSLPKRLSKMSHPEDTAMEVHHLAEFAILPSVAIIMMSMLVSSYLSSFPYAVTKFIPECLITVTVALLLGFMIRRLIIWGTFSVDSFELVDASILNLVLLPIIIFNGAWSLHLPHFSSQFTYCIIFAVGGTIITMMVVAYLSWHVADALGWPQTFRSTLAFSALISATDPVATLATYAELDIARRQPLLNTLVLGESLINDAVAIVCFNAVNNFDKGVWHGIPMGLATRMGILLFGSMIFGIVIASALILLMRIAQLPGTTTMEILYIFMAPFLVFSLADALELSGIIAVLFAGIMMKTYGTQHLTSKGRHLAEEFLEVAAKLCDTGVFVLCGTSTALIDSLDGVNFGLWAVLFCFVARAAATVFCSATSNVMKRVYEQDPVYITGKHGFMIWLGGLRGGIALVLALELDTSWCPPRTKEMIINATFFTICALLLLCGGTTELFLVSLGMVPPPEDGERKHSHDGLEDFGHEESLSEEHVKLGHAEDPLPGRIGRWLHGWFEIILVGESTELKRKQSAFSDLNDHGT